MTEEKIYKITGVVFGLLFITIFSLACTHSYENKKLKEDVSNLEKQIKEKNKFLQEKNHIIETILEKCGDRCE